MDKTVKAGVVIQGAYKRAGRPSRPMALEVSGVFERPDIRSTRHTYILGVDVASGVVIAVRGTGFDPRRTTVSEATGFVSLPLEHVYITGNGGDAFAFVEVIECPEDVEWCIAAGGQPFAELAVECVVLSLAS